MAKGEDTGSHPNRQVGRFRYQDLSPDDSEDEGEYDGPQNDDWIQRAYWNQAGPNPNYRGKPGGS